MKSINVIKFISFEDLGYFESYLLENGYIINYFQAGVDDLSLALASEQILFILGGPVGVYELDNYPFLDDLLKQLKSRLEKNRPTLGICLGAQLIASALGAKVHSSSDKEIGWGQIQLNVNAILSPFADVHVLHWHGDTFDLPRNSQHLASSAVFENQAFRIGENILALQFHPEVDFERIETWLIGHTVELKQANININQIRADSIKYGGRLKKQGTIFLQQWLENLSD